ncbi:pyruvate/2-oxoglutarate dehydrogenase complex dihydrolipoamide dehydrogenase (E3) component [Streptacidiphilus sp. MAP12-20]|uniref:hypothetical protein n=1 Tax=Streptacidiphilus sp. MAP12-20 TaxID=3156299 RepID=UPI0035186580
MGTVTVLTGKAVFTDPQTVRVDTAEGTVVVTGENILINTGSQPVLPDIPGLRTSSAASSTDAFNDVLGAIVRQD